MIFCRELQPFISQHSKICISKRNYDITDVIFWRRFVFPDFYYNDGPSNFFISFCKILYKFGIWDSGLAYSFWDHVILISFRAMNFQDIVSLPWKVKILFGNIYSLYSNSYFSRNSSIWPIWIFIFDIGLTVYGRDIFYKWYLESTKSDSTKKWGLYIIWSGPTSLHWWRLFLPYLSHGAEGGREPVSD